MSTAIDAPSASRPARNAWLALSVLLFTYLVNFMDRQLFAVLQEEIRADLGLSDFQLALLGGSMFAVFYATAGLPLAWFADRTHRVRLIAVSCAVWSVFTALSGAALNFWQMALARIGVATGEAGGVSPSYSVLSDYFPASRRGLAIGLFSIGAPLGLMAGTALGAIIADALSWRWAFVILGAPGILLALGIVFFVREPKRGRFDGDRSGDAKAHPFGAITAVLSTPTLRYIALAAALTSFGGYGFYQWFPSFLIRTQGMALEDAGRLLAPVFLVGVVGAIAGGWLADKLGQARPFAYGAVPAISILIGVPFFVLALQAPDGPTSLLFITIPTLLGYAWIGPVLAAAQTLSRPEHRASVAALLAFFNNLLGIGLGPLAVGAISDSLSGRLGEAEALRVGLLSIIAVYVIAAALFFAAGATLKRDLARAA